MRNLFFLNICALLLSTHILYAQISGTSMGGITTVTFEKAIDTTRNPALLGLLEAPTINVLALATPMYSQDTQGHIHSSDVVIHSIKNENHYYYAFSFFTGYATKITNGTIGYSISSKDNMYLKRKDTQKRIGDIPSLSLSFQETETTESYELNPTFTIAYALKATDSSFLGFQLGLTPHYSNQHTTNTNVNSLPLTITYDFTINEYGMILQPALGFFLYNHASQIGCRFILSTLKFIKTTVDADFTLSSTSYSDRWHLQQKEGPQLAVGSYTLILPFLGIALEAGLTLPSSYSETIIKIDNNSQSIKHKSNMVNNDPIIALKGGIQLSINDNLQCMSGVGYFHLVNTSGNNNAQGRGLFNSALITVGLNYILSHTITLSSLCFITYTNMDASFSSHETMDFNAKSTITNWIWSVGVGMSYAL